VSISLIRRGRIINAGDATKIAEFIERFSPVPSRLGRLLPELLRDLIAQGQVTGAAVEYVRDADPKPEPAAFGLSGFVSAEWADEYLSAPAPHVELILLDRASRGEPAFLSPQAVARGNAGRGLTLVPLLWLQATDDPADPEAHTLLRLGQISFIERHRGYRLARIIKETRADRAHAFIGGGFRGHCSFPAGAPLSFNPKAKLEHEHLIYTVTREDLDANWPGTAVGMLFAHQQPRCGFTVAEQEVLVRAAGGLTDARIAEDLAIKPAAVSMRWRSIYTRFARGAPPALRFEETSGARGQEKRRLVIAFVTEHPEELRPYARPARRTSAREQKA
jgi:DNA-binding CsgD family transcriptional regulator